MTNSGFILHSRTVLASSRLSFRSCCLSPVRSYSDSRKLEGVQDEHAGSAKSQDYNTPTDSLPKTKDHELAISKHYVESVKITKQYTRSKRLPVTINDVEPDKLPITMHPVESSPTHFRPWKSVKAGELKAKDIELVKSENRNISMKGIPMTKHSSSSSSGTNKVNVWMQNRNHKTFWWPDGVTILCHDIQQMDHSDMLKMLFKLPPAWKNTPTHCYLFVTPGLSSWLHDEHPFLSDLAKHLSKSITKDGHSHIIDFTIAIVDRIPGPVADTKFPTFVHTEALQYGAPGIYEGISMRASNKGGIYGYSIDNGVMKAEKPEHKSIDTPRPKTTESSVPLYGKFDRNATTHIPQIQVHGVTDDDRRKIWSISLQPANTLFINGQPVTMFGISAKVDPQPDTSLQVELSAQKKLSLISIPMRNDRLQKFFVPLVPITIPRRVISSMGNIISQLEGPGKKPMPASTELTQVIPRFLQDHDMLSTEVYAYIKHRPMSTTDSETDHKAAIYSAYDTADQRQLLTPDWSQALQNGVLRRVTGGGGEWGPKGGLLSFDPSVKLGDSLHESIPFDPDRRNAVSAIAQPDDTIQFFATPRLPPIDSRDAKEKDIFAEWMPTARDADDFSVRVFGKIPSMYEVVDTTRSVARHWTFVRNLFGLLSEETVAVSMLSLEENQSFWKATNLDSPYDRGSRLNVPYASLTYVHREKVKRSFGYSKHLQDPNNIRIRKTFKR